MSFLRYTPGAKPGVAPKRKAPEVTPPAEKRRAYEMKRKPRTFQSHWRDGSEWVIKFYGLSRTAVEGREAVADGGDWRWEKKKVSFSNLFWTSVIITFSVRSDMVRTSHLSMIAGPKDHLCKILKALTGRSLHISWSRHFNMNGLADRFLPLKYIYNRISKTIMILLKT